MKKIIFSILIVSLFFLVLSCDNGGSSPAGSSGSSSTKRQLILDINDSSNLYIGKSANSGSRDIGENKLFKITEDGYAKEVTYYYEVKTYDKNGKITGTKKEKATEVFNPEKIIKLNDNYILVSFNYSDNYLVDTKTGYCFSYPYSTPVINSRLNSFIAESIQTDEKGNIYCLTDRKLLKIDITNPKELSVIQISPSTERIEFGWAVDSKGNCAYEGWDDLENGVLRFKKESGGFINIPGDPNWGGNIYWQGFDGLIYYHNSLASGSRIKKIDNSTYEVSEVPLAPDTSIGNNWISLLKAKNKKRIVLVEPNKINEVYNPDNNYIKPMSVSTIGLDKIKFAISSDDYYYFVGSDESNKCKLVKVDPVTYSYEYLLSDGAYDVYNLSINNDAVIFNALRMSDGAIVMGRINRDKTIDIIDDKLESQVTVLERIN